MTITWIIVALLLGLVGGFLAGQSRGARQRAEIDDRLQQEAQRDADRIRAQADADARTTRAEADQDRQDATRRIKEASDREEIGRAHV